MSDKRPAHTLFIPFRPRVSKFGIYIASYNRFTRKSFAPESNSRVEIDKYLALNMRVGVSLFLKLLPQLVLSMIYLSFAFRVPTFEVTVSSSLFSSLS